MARPSVHATRELARIQALPTRDPEQISPAFVERLTMALRAPGGEQTLRTIQARALYEARACGGLLGPMRVGAGKTLISFLLPVVLGARRPMLVIPAKLRQKTERELAHARRHWRIPPTLRIESYERLGRTQHRDLLASYRPDVLIFDEAHRIKNPRASVTRRVRRFVEATPDVRCVFISGTITSRSIRDFAHLAIWALGTLSAPVPSTFHELVEWAEALDVPPSREPGALIALADPTEPPSTEAARRGYQRRLVSTPGVVATADVHDASCSISVTGIPITPPPVVQDAFALLRGEGARPDGWYLEDPFAMARHARQLGLGFYYRWQPDPPRVWLDARKIWAKACRHVIETNRRDLDTELAVIRAIDHYPEALAALEGWRAVKDTFRPRTETVWLTDQVLDVIVRWAEAEPGIVWVEDQAVGVALAQRTGLPFFAAGGKDPTGRPIEDADPKHGSIIASRPSSGEGRNLQRWSRALVTSPRSSGEIWEQMIGRMHREGQQADEVIHDVLFPCTEAIRAILTARERASYTEQITGQAQKLCLADVSFDLQHIDHKAPSWAGVASLEI